MGNPDWPAPTLPTCAGLLFNAIPKSHTSGSMALSTARPHIVSASRSNG